MKHFILSHQIVLLWGAVGAGVVIVVASLVLAFQTSDLPVASYSYPVSSPDEQINNSIVVEIQGAVVHPGVYKMPAKSRVVTLVARAGGFSQQADSVWVRHDFNQAQILKDGDRVYVQLIGETATKKTTTKK